VPLLEQAGHTVVAPDLPSLGRDKTPVSAVSLETWTHSICQIVDAQTEPVILVGHSRGDIVVSQVAEQRPQKVKTLVYMAAFLLRNGESLLQVLQEDGTSRLLPNLVMAEDQRQVTVKEEALKELFYGACSEEDVTLARLLLAPEAVGPVATPIRVTALNFGRVPRVYIACRRDQALPPALQAKMYTALPCQQVIALDTDHSPFFSASQELVAHLLLL
jgi:pimeloyl-ACP methyl ester carboxylesterase